MDDTNIIDKKGADLTDKRLHFILAFAAVAATGLVIVANKTSDEIVSPLRPHGALENEAIKIFESGETLFNTLDQVQGRQDEHITRKDINTIQSTHGDSVVLYARGIKRDAYYYSWSENRKTEGTDIILVNYDFNSKSGVYCTQYIPDDAVCADLSYSPEHVGKITGWACNNARANRQLTFIRNYCS